tara:strand:+ start:1179 stop:1304 length:126 start_codon:yes stop_codon:yes gene_type:complete
MNDIARLAYSAVGAVRCCDFELEFFVHNLPDFVDDASFAVN